MLIVALRYFLFVASITWAAPDVSTQQPTDAERFVVLANVHVIPMDSERIQKNMDIVVKGRSISQIVAAGTISHPSNARVIDCQ